MNFIRTSRPKPTPQLRPKTDSAIYATIADSNLIAFKREICHDFPGNNARSRRIQERTYSRFLEARQSRGHGSGAEESRGRTRQGISADHWRRENLHERKNAVDESLASEASRRNFSEGHCRARESSDRSR